MQIIITNLNIEYAQILSKLVVLRSNGHNIQTCTTNDNYIYSVKEKNIYYVYRSRLEQQCRSPVICEVW